MEDSKTVYNVTGLYFNPETLERKLKTITNENESYYELLNCDLIEAINLDQTTDIIVDEEGRFENDENPFVTVINYKDKSVTIYGRFIIVNLDSQTGEWRSIDLYKISDFNITLVSRENNLVDTAALMNSEERDIKYFLQVFDTATNKQVSTFIFEDETPLPVVEKFNTMNLQPKGRYQYNLIAKNGPLTLKLLPTQFSESALEVFINT